MKREAILNRLESEIDRLADIEHERWAHWQRYLHSKANRREDGSLVLSVELVEKWDRQMSTPYSELSGQEKVSDQEQVRKYISAVADILKDD